MKKLVISAFWILFFSLQITSCVKEKTPFDEANTPVQFRCDLPSEWCDGGNSNSLFISIVSVSTGSGGECCVTFFTCANTTVRFHTTDFNFKTCSGSQTGYDEYITSGSNGNFTHCWVPVASHYLIEFECGGAHRCKVFENPEC
jgi:hypothetical protein